MPAKNNQQPTVNICILTYRRPELLEQCLQSLMSMNIPSGIHLITTVIENDQEQQSRALVESLASHAPFALNYVCEPKRGIPVARNRALEFCREQHCDYIIFIDDDEWVDPNWLKNLYQYCQEQGGQAVISGKVIPILPDDIEEPIRQLFTSKDRPTGTQLTACATNNVILPIELYSQYNLRFDDSIPLAGGTDTKFFSQAHALGITLIKCDEAIVYENIPKTRANVEWLAERKYRVGITVAWRRKHKGDSVKKIRLSAHSAIAIGRLRVAMYGLTKNKLKQIQAQLRIHKARGILAGLKGTEVESYKNPQY